MSPDPEMRSPRTGRHQARADRNIGVLNNADTTETTTARQARSLAAKFGFEIETAATIAALAYAGCPR